MEQVAFAEHLATLPMLMEPLEELERKCLAQLRKATLQRHQHRPKESELRQQEGEGQRLSSSGGGGSMSEMSR